jgi:hypothetical protein
MPSRFEPRLNQMYSRPGTVPVVRKTGGPVDTVRPVSGRSGTDFSSARNAGGATRGGQERGCSVAESSHVAAIQRNGMAMDFSNSALQYLDLYDELVAPAPFQNPPDSRHAYSRAEYAPSDVLGLKLDADDALRFILFPRWVDRQRPTLAQTRWPGIFRWQGRANECRSTTACSGATKPVNGTKNSTRTRSGSSCRVGPLPVQRRAPPRIRTSGAQAFTVDGHAGIRFAVWAQCRTRQRSATSTPGTAGGIR